MAKKTALGNKLRAARQYIVKHGWIQGLAEDDKGRVCSLGACWKVDGDGRADEIFRASLPKSARGSVSEWNDYPRRTKAQVLAQFTKAALLADKVAK